MGGCDVAVDVQQEDRRSDRRLKGRFELYVASSQLGKQL
jgi:hypothetical protein